MSNKSWIERVRSVGKVEGLSYLLLLGIAMPLKYMAGMPMAVSIVGLIHGVHDLKLGEDLTVWLDPRHVYVFDEQGKMIAPASYALAA